MEIYTTKVVPIYGGYGMFLNEVTLGDYKSYSTSVTTALENILRKRLKYQTSLHSKHGDPAYENWFFKSD